jgi:hypothetical protein
MVLVVKEEAQMPPTVSDGAVPWDSLPRGFVFFFVFLHDVALQLIDSANSVSRYRGWILKPLINSALSLSLPLLETQREEHKIERDSQPSVLFYLFFTGNVITVNVMQ